MSGVRVLSNDLQKVFVRKLCADVTDLDTDMMAGDERGGRDLRPLLSTGDKSTSQFFQGNGSAFFHIQETGAHLCSSPTGR